jgi:predicted amidophosphoribosyltransferase
MRLLTTALAAAADFLAPDVCHLCGHGHDPQLEERFPLGDFASALTAPAVRGTGWLGVASHPICPCCAGGFRECDAPAQIELAGRDARRARGAPFPAGPPAAPAAGVVEVVAPFFTGAELLRVVHLLKFSRYKGLCDVVGAAAARALVRFAPLAASDVLVPVPMDPRSRRRRGFNQSAEIAGRVGRLLGMEVATVLRKPRRTRPQSLTPRAQRAANVSGAFLVSGADARGADLCLVDDLITTGATVAACAGALLAAGAARVRVLAVGRTVSLGGARRSSFLVP